MEKIIAENTIIRFLPNLSEKIPAGILAMIPVNADTPATIPTPVGVAPRCSVNKGSTGLLEMVELNIANNPEVQSKINGVNLNNIINYINITKE